MTDKEIWSKLDPKQIVEKEKRFESEIDYIEIGHFLNSKGYDFVMDADGMWFEDYCKDHKWKEIFDLMIEWREIEANKPDYADNYID